MGMEQTVKTLGAHVLATPTKAHRRLIALAGAPASGKSTLAESLVAHLNDLGEPSVLVPMDGFHLDNAVLAPRGLLLRKGAPQTFDAQGLLRLVTALAGSNDAVVFPAFDRRRDIAIAGAGVVTHAHRTVVVEGNYLLLNRPVWKNLVPLWDLSVFLDVPRDVLQARLVARWVSHGLSPADALARAQGNDLPNAEIVAKESCAADVVVPSGTALG